MLAVGGKRLVCYRNVANSLSSAVSFAGRVVQCRRLLKQVSDASRIQEASQYYTACHVGQRHILVNSGQDDRAAHLLASDQLPYDVILTRFLAE